jgi:alcohol dehydrogenase class IV
MKSFSYVQTTKIIFGAGKLSEIGTCTAVFGKKALLVTVPEFPAMAPIFKKTKALLKAAGIDVAHFDGVIPNPTTDVITAGANMAKKHKADVIIGLGGGSSMDSAKAIAVEATHPGSCWDYLFYKKPPTEKTLPVIAISTTSGTGSQVTQVAVVTNPQKRDKSALYNNILYPRVTIVDPELMLNLPSQVTAPTGFDVFCHAFESYIHPNSSPYIDMMALEAIRLVVDNLPGVLEDGKNLERRSAMAWADTMAGLCIANAGVTLPHGVGMAIGGMYPHIAHGESLALVYPAFTRFTYASAKHQFATMGRIFDYTLVNVDEETAARKSCDAVDNFLKKIGLWMGLKDKNVPKNELPALARQSIVLPDYKNNPRLASDKEMLAIIKECYERPQS